jgi:hypothetical protein
MHVRDNLTGAIEESQALMAEEFASRFRGFSTDKCRADSWNIHPLHDKRLSFQFPRFQTNPL